MRTPDNRGSKRPVTVIDLSQPALQGRKFAPQGRKFALFTVM
jgi:hypothetical protein